MYQQKLIRIVPQSFLWLSLRLSWVTVIWALLPLSTTHSRIGGQVRLNVACHKLCVLVSESVFRDGQTTTGEGPRVSASTATFHSFQPPSRSGCLSSVPDPCPTAPLTPPWLGAELCRRPFPSVDNANSCLSSTLILHFSSSIIHSLVPV